MTTAELQTLTAAAYIASDKAHKASAAAFANTCPWEHEQAALMHFNAGCDFARTNASVVMNRQSEIHFGYQTVHNDMAARLTAGK